VQSWEKLDGQVTTSWDKVCARRGRGMRSSIIREILKVTQQPDVISFAGGLPAPELFPVREFVESCRHVLVKKGREALQYSVTEGYAPLKEFLAQKARKYGVPADPPNIVLTHGAQQALDLVGKIFLDAGDVVLTERPTFLGALQAWSAYEARYVTVPLDDHGMVVDEVERILKNQKVKFIYVLPNFHNPGGTTLSDERRRRLVELTAEHGTFLVEDDPYGELRYEGEDLTPLIALHKENVVYISTFSKTLAPGIRLGWALAPQAVIDRLVQAKQGVDLHTSTLTQMVVHDLCHRGILRAHVERLRAVYKARRDLMLQTMEQEFPSDVKWTKPKGGLFLWVRLPEGVDSEELLRVAVQKERVAFVPGEPFFPPPGGGRSAFRLNFSNASEEKIVEGIGRLGKVLREHV
jgi:2-aminoadipate transaminase